MEFLPKADCQMIGTCADTAGVVGGSAVAGVCGGICADVCGCRRSGDFSIAFEWQAKRPLEGHYVKHNLCLTLIRQMVWILLFLH